MNPSHATPQSLYHLLQCSAAKHADAIALSYIEQLGEQIGSRQLSYAELWSDINRSARMILELAGKPRPVVSLLLPNIPQSQCLLWGAASVGVANPLNPLLNEEALYGLMLKAQTDVIFVLGPLPGSDLWQKAQNVAQRLPNRPRCVPVLAAGAELGYEQSLPLYSGAELEPELLPQATDIAAYFHTGGTTGLPKLACLTHANLLAVEAEFAARMASGPGDVMVNGLPIFHVAGALVLSLGTLGGGLQMVLPTLGGFRNPEVVRQYWRLVEHFKVTIGGAIPTSVAAIIEVPIENHDLSSLRFFISGGAPVPAALCERVRAVTGRELYQIFGMTECAGLITLPNLAKPSVPGSAGHVSGAIEVRIAGGQPCGEIQIRGPVVFPGYLGQTESPVQDGWLNSGDLGWLDADNNLFITGRAKDLIIRSGHNIDPALIENCLERHPAVALAAAVGMPDEYAGELPVVFVQLQEGATVSAEELQEFASAHIDERPACPKRIFLVERLPVTAVGKIFKVRLRELAAISLLHERLQVAGSEPAFEVTQQADGALALNLQAVPQELRERCTSLAEGLSLRLIA